MKFQLRIKANRGYSANQPRVTTVKELRAMLYDLDDTDEIVLYNEDNPQGAAYGEIIDIVEAEQEPDDID